MSIDTKLCLSCMEEHEVQQVAVTEENIFKGKRVEYPARYEYCPSTEAYAASDEMIDANDISFKDAYRKYENHQVQDSVHDDVLKATKRCFY